MIKLEFNHWLNEPNQPTCTHTLIGRSVHTANVERTVMCWLLDVLTNSNQWNSSQDDLKMHEPKWLMQPSSLTWNSKCEWIGCCAAYTIPFRHLSVNGARTKSQLYSYTNFVDWSVYTINPYYGPYTHLCIIQWKTFREFIHEQNGRNRARRNCFTSRSLHQNSMMADNSNAFNAISIPCRKLFNEFKTNITKTKYNTFLGNWSDMDRNKTAEN